MADLPIMPLWVDKFVTDTSHLNAAETGAYLLILLAMWRNGGSLPNDPARLARIARMPLDKWRKASSTVMEFMTVEGEVITQKRLSQTRNETLAKQEKRQQAGSLGGQAKALKNQGRVGGNASTSPVASEQHPPANQNHIHKEETPSGSADAPDPRQELFRRGLDTVVRMTGKAAPQARTLLGRWLRDAGDEAVIVLEAIDACVENRPADPVPWISGAISNRMERRREAKKPQRAQPGQYFDF